MFCRWAYVKNHPYVGVSHRYLIESDDNSGIFILQAVISVKNPTEPIYHPHSSIKLSDCPHIRRPCHFWSVLCAYSMNACGPHTRLCAPAELFR